MKQYTNYPKDKLYIGKDAEVTVTKAGNTITVAYVQRKNKEIPIVKLSDEEYIVKSTGEVKSYAKNKERSPQSVHRSANTLRNLILENVTNTNAVMLTLTYADCVDTERMQKDLENFMKKLRRRHAPFEYIVKPELQKRGVWHYHILLIFPDKPPFIDYYWLSDIWSNGYTFVTPVNDIDKTAKYMIKSMFNADSIAKYPAGMKLYSTSKGIRQPQTYTTTKGEADKLTKGCQIIYEHILKIQDEETNYQNLVSKTVYKK